MDLVSHDLSYILLLLFGGFAVAVHAFSLYGAALPQSADQQLLPILDNVSLEYLGGPRSYMTGFVCYLGITEFLYLVLSSSSVILEISLSFIGDEKSIGALTKDSSTLNPMTPVLASSVIMTVSQFKPFSQIENAIRRISHHVAGIPHSVYEIVSQMNSFRYEVDAESSKSPSVANASRYANEVHAAASKCNLDALAADYLADNILRIFSLKAWTFGQDGERLWSRQSTVALRKILANVIPRQSVFEEKLRSLLKKQELNASESPTDADLEQWREISRESIDIRNDLTVLFALFSINQPQLRVPEDAGQMRRLLRHVKKRKQAQEINVLFGATAIGLSGGLALVSLYYMISLMSRYFLDVLLAGGSLQSTQLTSFTDWTSYVFLVFQRSIEVGMRDVVSFGLIFFVSAVVALSVRSTRIASMQWTYWRHGTLPFRQYLSVASMATLIAFLLYTLLSFYRLVIQPAFMLEGTLIPPSLLNDFRQQYAFYYLIPLTGMMCSWFVCMMADRLPSKASSVPFFLHRETTQWAFRFAAFSSLLHALIRVGNGSITQIGGAIDALVVPGILFFMCFNLFGTLSLRLKRAGES